MAIPSAIAHQKAENYRHTLADEHGVSLEWYDVVVCYEHDTPHYWGDELWQRMVVKNRFNPLNLLFYDDPYGKAERDITNEEMSTYCYLREKEGKTLIVFFLTTWLTLLVIAIVLTPSETDDKSDDTPMDKVRAAMGLAFLLSIVLFISWPFAALLCVATYTLSPLVMTLYTIIPSLLISLRAILGMTTNN
jgi:hypothetical protein